MSEHKKKNKTTNTTGIVVGGGKKQLKIGVQTRLSIVILACLVILLVAIVATLFVVHREQSQTKQASQNGQSSSETKLTPEQNIGALTHSGKYEDAEALINKQLASAKTDKDKQYVYMQLTSNAIQAKQYDKAMNYAKQSDALKPTNNSAYLLATVAKLQGNNAQARDYLNTAIKRIDTHEVNKDGLTLLYQNEIKALTP